MKTSSVGALICIHSFCIAAHWISTILPADCVYTDTVDLKLIATTQPWKIYSTRGVALHVLGWNNIVKSFGPFGSESWMTVHVYFSWLLDDFWMTSSNSNIFFVFLCQLVSEVAPLQKGLMR
jgi:hypothetical protein